MVSKIGSANHILDAILDQPKKEILNFTGINFFHVLWKNNQIADHFANKATLLKGGVNGINGNQLNQPIP
jgi:hypothetical protein